MVCRRCTADVPEGSVFCPKCGCSVKAVAEAGTGVPGISSCRRCGNPLLSGSKFCRKCGETVPVPYTHADELVFRRPRGKVRMLGWFLLLGLVLFAAWAVLTDNPVSVQFQKLFHRSHTEAIGIEVFSVQPGKFSYFKFKVPPMATDVSISGEFEVQAKPASDIDAQLLTDTGFVSWQDGYSANSYYESGRVAHGTINVLLPAAAGTYYLVFDNKFSRKASKTVHSDITLTYRQWWPIF